MNNSPKCLVCGATDITIWASAKDAEYMTTDETFQFYRCSNCHVLFIDPVPVERLNIIYPNNYYSYASPKRSIVTMVKNWLDRRIFKKLFDQLPGESLRVLDIGGGAGRQLDILRTIERRISSTYLVDLDSNAKKLAC